MDGSIAYRDLHGSCLITRPEVAPKKQTCDLSPTLLPLELLWTPIAQCPMQALAVIEQLDMLRNRIPCFHLMCDAPEQAGCIGQSMCLETPRQLAPLESLCA